MAESDDEDFAALFAASEEKRTRERRVAAGDVVRGRVIAVGSTAAFVAVGGKAEATIELGEFRDPSTGAVQLHGGARIAARVVAGTSQVSSSKRSRMGSRSRASSPVRTRAATTCRSGACVPSARDRRSI